MADRSDKDANDHAQWQAERRDKMAAEGLRALLLLNGGGAIALLAFAQAIWSKECAQALIPWVLFGVIFLAFGATLSGLVHFVRYSTTEAYQMKGNEAGRTRTLWHKVLTYAGFAAFFFGILITVTGAFLHLPYDCDETAPEYVHAVTR